MNALATFTDSRLAYAVASNRIPRKSGRRLAPTALEIVMLYDEDGARDAGDNLCNRVLTQLGSRYAFKLLPWKLTVTQFPMLTDIVAREAERSPFLLVTINGEMALTPVVETFIRRCASAMQRSHSALVVQLHGIDKAQKESSPAYQCLTRIADDANIPIFSTVVDLNQQSRGAGRASPHRSGSPFVAIPPQTLPQNS